MKLKYKDLYIEKDKYYSIGVDELTKEYVIEVVILSVAWYSRYFRITEEEFQYFNNENKEILDNLAVSLRECDVDEHRDRFVYSDLSIENQK